MDEVKWKKISNVFLLIALFFACILAIKDVKDKYPKINPTQMSMFYESKVDSPDSTSSKEDKVFG